jgi:hypothetical protein
VLTRLELSASYPTKLNIEHKIRSFREQDLSIVIHKFSDRSGSGNRLLRSLCNRTKVTKFQARDRQNRTKTINAFPAYGAMAAFRVPALRLQPQPALVIDRRSACTWDQPVHGTGLIYGLSSQLLDRPVVQIPDQFLCSPRRQAGMSSTRKRQDFLQVQLRAALPRKRGHSLWSLRDSSGAVPHSAQADDRISPPGRQLSQAS